MTRPELTRLEDGSYDFSRVRKVLIIKTSSMGDILHATPVARAVRETLPEAKIGWIVGDIFREVVECSPLVDQLFVVPTSYWRKGLGHRLANWREAYDEYRSVFRQVRAEGYELAVDLQENLLLTVLVRVAGVPLIAGYDDARSQTTLLTNVQVDCRDPELGARGRPLRLAQRLGMNASGAKMELAVTAEDRERALSVLEGKGVGGGEGFVALAPRTSWQSKCWLWERYAQLADRLVRERSLTVVLLGGAGDRGYVERIQERMEETAVPLAGELSLRETGVVLGRARACITGDTGLLYIALAQGTPSVGIFGPTSSTGVVMAGEPGKIVHHRDKCRCYLRKRRFCPDQPCMHAVTVEEVMEALGELVGDGSVAGDQ